MRVVTEPAGVEGGSGEIRTPEGEDNSFGERAID